MRFFKMSGRYEDAEGDSRPRRGINPVGMNAVAGSGRLSLRSVRTHEGSAPSLSPLLYANTEHKKTAEPNDYAIFKMSGRYEDVEGDPRPRHDTFPVGMNAVAGSERLSLRSVRTHEGSAPSFHANTEHKKTAEPDDYAVF